MGSIYSIESDPLDLASPDNINVRVCLYGETEEASVRLTPDAFISETLIVNEPFTYTFNIRNNSKDLPITYQYNKVTFVEMEPSLMTLGPRCSVDVTLIIKPKKMGRVEKNITISLLFTSKDGKTFDVGTTHFSVCFEARMNVDKTKGCLASKFVNGITPICTNEVGYLVDDVRFNTDIEKPIMAIVNPKLRSFNENNDALIAFPNDRIRSVRPHTNNTP